MRTLLTVLMLVGMAAARAGAQAVVINEVDYDQPGVDSSEFVELRSNSACPVDLTHLALVFINGANNAEYSRVSLAPAGTLAPGQYLVLCTTSVFASVPPTALRLTFALANDNIQNGSPDGIALVDTVRLVILDSLSYEGSMTAANITGFPGPVSLVHGTALPSAVADNNSTPGSLARFPDGADTDNDAGDWVLTSTPTPGAGNGGAPAPLRSCCGSADFNCDGDIGTDLDIEAFFACLSGTCPSPPCTGSADFNHDGDIGTDLDIEAFFRVLAGGSC